jgi:hypothetical protein
MTESDLNASFFFANMKDSCKALTANGLGRSERHKSLTSKDLWWDCPLLAISYGIPIRVFDASKCEPLSLFVNQR